MFDYDFNIRSRGPVFYFACGFIYLRDNPAYIDTI